MGVNAKLSMSVAQLRKYEAGDSLVRKGLSDERLFILLSGSLAVYDGEPESADCLAVLKPGDFFGEAALLTGKPCESTVAALTDSMVLAFGKDDMADFVSKQPQAAIELMQALCVRSGALVDISHVLRNSLTPQQRRYLVAEASHGAAPPLQAPRPVRKKTAPVPTAPSPVAAPPAPVKSDAASPAPTVQPTSAPTVPQAVSVAPDAPLSSLFPPGHGRYGAVKKPHDTEYLRDKSLTCPLCRTAFRVIVPRSSKLITESTDPDMRTRFRVIEPMYYEICTCPNCLYSALTELFPNGFSSRAAMIRDRLGRYQSELSLKQRYDMDMDTVFASYYLALQCAQPCFDSHLTISSMLWLKISRLYADCDDKAMYRYANEEALKAYQKVYDNANVSGEKAQRLYISIAECAFAAGDISLTKRFFYMAKVEKGSSSAALKDHADRRLEDVREFVQSNGVAQTEEHT